MNADVSNVLGLLSQHKYVAIAAVLIGLLVRILKDERTDAFVKIDPKLRPALALGLGVVGGVLTSLSSSVDLVTAISSGLAAGSIAIAGHDTIVNGLRDGKEILEPK